MAQHNSIPILNNSPSSPSMLSSPQEAAEQAKANAHLLVNTLRMIVERQNELSHKVEFLEQEVSHLKLGEGAGVGVGGQLQR